MGRLNLLRSLVLLAALGTCLAAVARDRPPSTLGAGWIALDPVLLDSQRGGLALPSGLQVSFGFVRTVHVNGALVSALRVNVADVSHIGPAEAAQLAELARGQVLQLGEGNLVQGQGAGLVLQNTLDHQQIQVQTTLEAGTGALGVLQALNAGEALRTANATAVGGL